MNVLPLTYLGNVQWFSKLCFTDCVIDPHEHYVKQSYRNRCRILTANGPATLVVNTVKTSNWSKASVRDTRIDYSRRWQHEHWNSLVSSYRGSPYFDHFAPEFERFYRERFDFLYDLNASLLSTVMRLLGSDAPMRFSEKYIEPGQPGITDWRNSISEKPRLSRPDPSFDPAPYWQVFSDRAQFVPNLSVIDLLFCEGPATLEVIRRSAPGAM
jgi:hypothetical protein